MITTNFRDTTTPDIHRTYDANGNIKTVQRGGVNWSYAYNDADLITSENLDIDGRHYDLSYRYDSLGRMVSQYLPAAGVARQQLQYQYDSLDRATRGNYPGTPTPYKGFDAICRVSLIFYWREFRQKGWVSPKNPF